ncbi:hypothetical protein [Enterococcus casseliflavus]|uniref:hypothetical protein n=1 Tax=Enterococcus casseliflavus TaxID=37734 RepID=UPI001D16BCAB|nr:hypothetical protein [Enterococcus casseliflavus]
MNNVTFQSYPLQIQNEVQEMNQVFNTLENGNMQRIEQDLIYQTKLNLIFIAKHTHI